MGGNVAFAGRSVEETLRAAVTVLGELGRVTAGSGLWRSEPVGPVREQASFVNGAVVLETRLAPGALMGRLLEVEKQFGRVRSGVAKGPRTLDMDLLLVERVMGGVAKSEAVVGEPVVGEPIVCDEAGLRLPHPEMARRRFVLAPLEEIAAGVRHPLLGKTIAELLRDLPEGDWVERVDGPGLMRGLNPVRAVD
jgi:2-amino-4-hydroxy-6-hydroxymethyldihydropteridine diphosphokinase